MPRGKRLAVARKLQAENKKPKKQKLKAATRSLPIKKTPVSLFFHGRQPV